MMAISCSRLLWKLGNFARRKCSSYGSDFELNTTLMALSWTRSSFRLSDALQKCHISKSREYSDFLAYFFANVNVIAEFKFIVYVYSKNL